MRRALVGLVAACVAIYGVGVLTPPTPPVLQGDSLGRQIGEGWGKYGARTRASISNSTQPAFAMVTFRTPLSAQEAARVVEGTGRVSALLLADAPPRALPEPTPGHTRADVFAQHSDGEPIAALVIRADGERLRSVADEPDVAAVEALPADAVWGAFAILPVTDLSQLR